MPHPLAPPLISQSLEIVASDMSGDDRSIADPPDAAPAMSTDQWAREHGLPQDEFVTAGPSLPPRASTTPRSSSGSSAAPTTPVTPASSSTAPIDGDGHSSAGSASDGSASSGQKPSALANALSNFKALIVHLHVNIDGVTGLDEFTDLDKSVSTAADEEEKDIAWDKLLQRPSMKNAVVHSAGGIGASVVNPHAQSTCTTFPTSPLPPGHGQTVLHTHTHTHTHTFI